METLVVSVILGLWLVLFVPMALVTLLPKPYDRTADDAAPVLQVGRQQTAGQVGNERSAA